MPRFAFFRILFDIADEKFKQIGEQIDKGVKWELKAYAEQNKQIVTPFYQILKTSLSSLEIGLGLDRFILDLSISTKPNDEKFTIRTYHRVNNLTDERTNTIFEIPGLEIIGSTKGTLFLDKDWDETSSHSYVEGLLKYLDNYYS